MSKIVAPGSTLHAHGTLTRNAYLVVQYGAGMAPGGVVDVLGDATNNGRVSLYGSNFAGIGGATGTIEPNGVLTNAGYLNLYGGREGAGAALSIFGTLKNTGVVAVGAGYPGAPASLGIAPGGTFDNAGVLEISLLAGFGINARSNAGATLSAAGVVANSGSLSVEGGITGYAIGPQGPAYYGSQGGVLNLTGVLTNSGQLDLNGGVDRDYTLPPVVATGAALRVYGPGELINMGAIYIQAASIFVAPDGATGAVLDVMSSLDNQGTLTVAGSSGAYFGPAASGTLVVAGVLSNAGLLDVTPGIEGYVSGTGGVVVVSGLLINSGELFAGAGYAINNHRPQHFTDGATIEITGALTNSALLDLQTSQSFGTYNASAQLTDGGTLTNSGTLDIEGGSKTGVLGAGVTITPGGVLVDNGVIEGGGTLDNEGQVVAEGSVAIDIATLTNTGIITVGGFSALTIETGVGGGSGEAGSFSLGGGLTLDGSVAADQTVIFASAGGLLALGNAFSFYGVIDGLGQSSTLDFVGLNVISATSAGTQLGIGLAGGETLDLRLGAPLPDGTTLTLVGDGHDGTDLIVASPGQTGIDRDILQATQTDNLQSHAVFSV